MINSWSKFNENSDNKREELVDHFQTIRDNFLEFEDIGIVDTYRFSISYTDKRNNLEYEPNAGITFSPDNKRYTWEEIIDIWIEFHHNTISILLDRKVIKEDIFSCINISLKLPSEKNTSLIGNDGIKLFDNILEINSRLIDSGYDIKLDMNGQHPLYKPMEFKIFFKLN